MRRGSSRTHVALSRSWRRRREADGLGRLDMIDRMGPLAGLRVLEFEAIGPAPFAGMMLADMGSDVLLVDRATDARIGFGR